MDSYLIHETFQSTIQGEGFWAGTVADFVRLFGCPVRCPWCDTGYSSEAPPVSPIRLTSQQIREQLVSPRVIISGGEPMFQDIAPLVHEIESDGRFVSVETSGAAPLSPGLSETLWVTLSPKQHTSKYPVRGEWWKRADEVKLVIESCQDFEFYKEKLSTLKCPIFLQPEWTSREVTIPLTLTLLREFPIARLSLQQHKILGLP